MPDAVFGPWPTGIDNISEPTALKEGAVVDAVNGWFKRGGHFTRRFNETPISTANCHSGYTSSSGLSFAVVAGVLSTVAMSPTLSVVPLHTMPSDDPVSYAEVNDEVLFASMFELGVASGAGVTLLGVEMPGGFFAAAAGAGGLDAGRYGVAVSFLAGTEEGGLSDVQFVDVAQGGGITIDLPSPIEARTTGIRVYRTPCNGDTLYRAIDLPVLANVLIGTDTLTVMAETQFKTRMVGGDHLRIWRGRAVVARGHTLYFSDPMRYGLRDARHGFIQMPERITFVEALDTGMYVGTTKKVYWLQGTSPKELIVRVVEQKPAVGGASLVMPVSDTGLESNHEYTAVWLGANGYCFGMPDGNVERPVSTVFSLDTLGTTGKLALLDGVLTTVVH
jgi:hypothetical protein